MIRKEEAFVAFYQEHWVRLVAAVSVVLPEGTDAEDVAQEAFTRAFEHWNELDGHPRPDGWLFLTAYRLVASLRRRLAVRLRIETESTRAESTAGDPEIDPLLVLTHRQRAAVLARHYYGLSTRETARALRCREGTVKSLLARARESLIQAEEEVDR